MSSTAVLVYSFEQSNPPSHPQHIVPGSMAREHEHRADFRLSQPHLITNYCKMLVANMQLAEQTANKNRIRWWSQTHVKRMAPAAPQSKALVIHPERRRPRGRPRNRWEVDIPRWYKQMGMPMTDVNNWARRRWQKSSSKVK